MPERTLAERAYHYIRDLLARGTLSPGKRLVNRKLASEIGVSVIPVREAIHRLATEGLVEHVPGSGAFVRKTDPGHLDNLYVLRDALESCAAGEAARYINELQLAELEAICSEASLLAKKIQNRSGKYATQTQLDRWLDLEQQFHELLIEAARNPLLAKVTDEHRALAQIFDAQRASPQMLTAQVAKQTCQGKKDLINALRKKDHRRARDLMSEQIQRGRSLVLRHLRHHGQ